MTKWDTTICVGAVYDITKEPLFVCLCDKKEYQSKSLVKL